MYHKILLRTLLLTVTTLGLVSCLSQDENIQSSSQIPDKTTTPTVKNTHNTPLQQQGLTVAVDPTTGTLRAPTAEEKHALSFQEKQVQGVTTGLGSGTLEEKVLPDGTVMIDLKGQFQHQINVEVINCEQDNKNKACSQKTDNH